MALLLASAESDTQEMRQSPADVRFEGRAIASFAFGMAGVLIVLLKIAMDAIVASCGRSR